MRNYFIHFSILYSYAIVSPCRFTRRVVQDILQLMVAADSSGDSSDSDSSDDDDLELMLLENCLHKRHLGTHLNFEDISEDDFESLFRYISCLYHRVLHTYFCCEKCIG